ncbi:MAG: hypothetical protein AWU59_1322 [Methanolobus sp. T82-4]|nr:MAG: hypothetical protein AWU59_1322 [Methanolobus sp. T82-4]
MNIILAGGFKGLEKENTVISIAKELVSRGNKVALLITEHLENENGKTDTGGPGLVIREKISSCVSCSFIFDLIAEIENMNEQGPFDHMVIELPFNSMPFEVKESLENYRFPDVSFSPVIHIFDINSLEIDATLIPRVVSNQIKESDIVFVNTDHATPDKVTSLREVLGQINPDVEIFESSYDSKYHGLSDFVDMITTSSA